MHAPFDISKSPKKDLRTPEDYVAIANSCFDNALHFHRLSIYPVLTGDIVDISGPAVAACLAFSCELFIKSLLYFHQTPFDRMHQLHDLYNLLPSEAKEIIFSMHPMTGEEKNAERFELCLREVGKTFEVVRYIHECSAMAVQYQFLFELSMVLHFFAKQELDYEDKVEGFSASSLRHITEMYDVKTKPDE